MDSLRYQEELTRIYMTALRRWADPAIPKGLHNFIHTSAYFLYLYFLLQEEPSHGLKICPLCLLDINQKKPREWNTLVASLEKARWLSEVGWSCDPQICACIGAHFWQQQGCICWLHIDSQFNDGRAKGREREKGKKSKGLPENENATMRQYSVY